MNHNFKKQPLFTRKACVVATEFAVAMMAAPFAFAQASPPAVKIEVTGSRIPLQQNVESTSPIAIISAEDVKIEGVRNTENLLTNMPQVFSDQGSTVSNGATGTATVSLRNLGADRTLVLVNGKRMPAGSPLAYATDLNSIPAQLIQRVEILTGGASAIYGSDAVAGVVNFIMRRDFEGVQGDIGYSFYQHEQGNSVASVVAAREATNPSQFRVPGDVGSDGEGTDVSLMIGSNFANNRGNATVFFGWKEEREVLQGSRDYSACSLNPGDVFTCGGSGTNATGNIITAAGARTNANAAGNTRPNTAADQFNFGPYNYFQRPSERYSFAAFTHYDINNHLRAYMDFMFHDDLTLGQIAPSGIFLGPLYTIHGDNPLLSADWRRDLGVTNTPGSIAENVVIGRRNVEGGGRQNDLRHTSYRTVIGFKGDVAKYWDYDVFYQNGKVLHSQTYLNDFSNQRITRALDVVVGPDGTPVCRSVVDGTDPACVPYNIWRLGGITQEALDYIQIPLVAHGYTYQSVWGGTVSSDLGNYGVRLPSSKNGVGIAFGIERRVEKLNFQPDAAYASGDGAGQGGPTIALNGKYEVKEAFIEARVPILEGAPMADLLSVNGSFRYSDYDTGKQTDSYGLGIEWGPTPAFKFRGSYQQAVRAANIIELFQAQGTNLYDNTNDPCGPARTATQAECARTGLTAAQYGTTILDSPAGQYNYIQGGNPALEPETAKSFTIGAVFTPMRNFSASIDWYQIEVEDVIDVAPPVTILNNCLATGSAAFCSLITRDPTFGTLWLTGGQIVATNQNLGKLETSGVDISLNYNYGLGPQWGGLGFNFIGTWLDKFEQTDLPGSAPYQCQGLYGATCGIPLPEWRHKFRVTWSTPWNVDISGTWRYIDKTNIDTVRLGGTVPATDIEMDAQNYFDIAASWAVNKQLTLRGGINNLLDEDPPIISSITTGTTGNGNTYPQTYDALGRRIFFSATYKF
jgi:outer membrane receptor protein involved in Fe transport